MTKEEIIDVIHKTMYQFFDVCGDNEEVPMSDKDELLLSVNKAICNNIKALEESCEDAVSRKTIVEMLNARGQGSVMTFDNFIELLYKLPSVTPTQRWIPCSGLPNIHNRCERYYVTLKSGDVDIAMFTECNGEHWWNFNFDDVIAWQYLPEPYVPDTNVGKMEEIES